ncbi:MAG TPA: hypothetical protein VF138_11520 [Caulobacteraceae bacterium]
MMALQIGLVAAIMLLTAATQMMGLWLLLPVARRLRGEEQPMRHSVVLMALAVGLLALHSFQIFEYATLYWMLHAFSFETAVYFSASAYSTIGTSQAHLPHEWRLLGAFEGINGFVMIGWSSAFLFGAWTDLLREPD